VIVLGGIYGQASQAFADDLKARLHGRAQPELLDAVVVRRTALGRLGGLQGAALIALDRLLAEARVYQS
jgi:hypothetical protein